MVKPLVDCHLPERLLVSTIVYMCVYPCILCSACVHASLSVCVCMCVRVHACVYMYVYLCVSVRTCTCTSEWCGVCARESSHRSSMHRQSYDTGMQTHECIITAATGWT